MYLDSAQVNSWAGHTPLNLNEHIISMKEVSYKELKFNPFNLLGKEWMLISAGSEQTAFNTMTISWVHHRCLWGHKDPTAVVYLKEAKLVFICKKEYAAELQESGFVDKDIFHQAYPLKDLHTMYVGKIEKVLVRDDEYVDDNVR